MKGNSPYINKNIIIIISLHLVLFFLILGGNNLLTNNTIYNYDYPFHKYFCETSNFFNDFSFISYDPNFNGGLLLGIILDNEFMQLFCSIPLLKDLFNLGIFIIYFILPILIYKSLKNFNLSNKESFWGTIIYIIYFYLDGFFRTMIYLGMFNFIATLTFSFFLISIFYKNFKLNKKTSIKNIFFIFFIGLLHSSFFLVFFPTFIILFFKKKDFFREFYKSFLSLPIPLTFIIIPYLKYISPQRVYYREIFVFTNLKDIFKDLFLQCHFCQTFDFNILKLIFLIGGLLAIIYLKREKKKFLLITIIYILLSYFIYFLPGFNILKVIEPFRYIYWVNLILLIPISRIIIKFRYKFIILILLLLLPSMLYTEETFNIKEPKDYTHLKNWIINNTNKSERILFESNIGATEFFEKPSYSLLLMKKETGRHFYSSLHHSPDLFNNFPSISKNEVFRQKWEENTLKDYNYFIDYNIKWVIVRSNETKEKIKLNLDSNILKKIINIDEFQIYSTNLDSNNFIKGSAKLKTNNKKIIIEDIKSEELIIKFNYLESLKITGNATILPYYIKNNPNPFIKIKTNGEISLNITR